MHTCALGYLQCFNRGSITTSPSISAATVTAPPSSIITPGVVATPGTLAALATACEPYDEGRQYPPTTQMITMKGSNCLLLGPPAWVPLREMGREEKQ